MPKKTARLRTITQCAEELTCHVRTVSELVTRNKIETFPIPHNGNGKGIDEKGFEKLQRLLPVASSR